MTNSFIYDRLSYFQRFVKRHEDLQSKEPVVVLGGAGCGAAVFT